MFESTLRSKIIGLVDGNVLSLCPTMDLIVLSMNKMSIWVFRLNGERIYSINNKAIILDLTWSPDGKYFGLSGVDGYCKVYDTNNGELINQFEVSKPIELINWCQDQSIDMNPTDEEQLNEQSNQGEGDDEELFSVNILDNLPTTHDFLDFRQLNYLIVSSNNQLSIIFNNLVRISYPKSFKFIKNLNEDLFNQYYIAVDEILTEAEYKLVKLSISPPESITRILLIFCKIKLLLTNLKKHLQQLATELVMFFNVFDRYLSNYYDNLDQSVVEISSKHETIIKSFTGILISHLIPNNLTDYWLSQLGDRGFKRLEKLGNNNYDMVRNITYKHLITLLEKLLLLMTELRTIVEFNALPQNATDVAFNINISDLNNSIDEIKAFIKRLYNFIWDCNDEQKLYTQFLRWVKFLIDTLTKHNNDDDFNLSVDFDYIQLINYFNFNLFHSKILDYLPLELNTEVLPTNNGTTDRDIMSQFQNKIENVIEQTVFHKFETFFNSMISITSLPELKVNIHCEFVLVNGVKVIISIENNIVHLFQIINDTKVLEKHVELIKSIVSYKIFHDQLIVLVKDDKDEFYLECYSITDLLNRQESSKVHHPRHQIKLCQAPQYLFINNRKNYGCLLESNKKDYSIFQL